MMQQAYFEPSLFAFLDALCSNNTREWLQANKERYESEIREPMLNFISDFGPYLQHISPRFVADPRRQGGSMFRQ